MGRRGENIFHRQDGRWEARFIWSYSSDGKAKYRYLYGKTYAEAKEKRNALLAELAKPASQPVVETAPLGVGNSVQFEDVLDEWLQSTRNSVKESSFVNYSYLVEHYIAPELGGYDLLHITNEVANTFLKEKLEHGRKDGSGGLSSKTVGDIRPVLLQAFDYASGKGYACNVKGRLFSPKASKKPIRVLSHSEQKQLETILFHSDDPVHLGVLIALYCGLRIGEVCTLQWGDLNLEDSILFVSKTVMRIQDRSAEAKAKTKIVITPPKTDASIRFVPIPTFLRDYLQEMKESNNIYILAGTTEFMEPRCCLGRYKRLLKMAGLDSLTFHTLRHTFATRCVEKGMDAKSLSEILGHSDVKTTLQRYVHPSMELKKSQVNLLEEFSIRSQNCSQS